VAQIFLIPMAGALLPDFSRFPLRSGKAPEKKCNFRKFLPDTLRIRNVVARDSPLGLDGPMKRPSIRTRPFKKIVFKERFLENLLKGAVFKERMRSNSP